MLGDALRRVNQFVNKFFSRNVERCKCFGFKANVWSVQIGNHDFSDQRLYRQFWNDVVSVRLIMVDLPLSAVYCYAIVDTEYLLETRHRQEGGLCAHQTQRFLFPGPADCSYFA